MTIQKDFSLNSFTKDMSEKERIDFSTLFLFFFVNLSLEDNAPAFFSFLKNPTLSEKNNDYILSFDVNNPDNISFEEDLYFIINNIFQNFHQHSYALSESLFSTPYHEKLLMQYQDYQRVKNNPHLLKTVAKVVKF
jgi:hypothetical protein